MPKKLIHSNFAQFFPHEKKPSESFNQQIDLPHVKKYLLGVKDQISNQSNEITENITFKMPPKM